jgi:hypothetical protein
MVSGLELGAIRRRMHRASRAAILEVVSMIMVPESEMTRLVMPRLVPPWLVPARRRRIVLEPKRPRLRFEVPAGRLVMMDELRAVTQDDADVERGHQIRVNRAVPMGRRRRRQDGDGAKRGGEQKMLTHGSSPNKVSQASSSLHRAV